MITTASRCSKERAGDAAQSLGRIKTFHGQMGMFIRALAFLMSHGGDGLARLSGDAVLNANYLLASLKDVLTPSFAGGLRCMRCCSTIASSARPA